MQEMAASYDEWADRCGVIPREKIVKLMSSQGVTRAFWENDEGKRPVRRRPALLVLPLNALASVTAWQRSPT